MIIVTNQYSTNIIAGIDQCKMMTESFRRHGHELAVLPDKYKGNGNVLRLLYECYKRAATGHHKFIYSDGGDTFCQRKIQEEEIPDCILYSTEKACYPRVEVAKKYKYTGSSPWKYLNGGGVCGPIPLMIEFMEKYGLNKLPNDCNGQHEQMIAFLNAEADGFPIKLDRDCEVFQTTAFADPSEFNVTDGLIFNTKTKTCPAILHGNGTSTMKWVYNAQHGTGSI